MKVKKRFKIMDPQTKRSFWIVGTSTCYGTKILFQKQDNFRVERILKQLGISWHWLEETGGRSGYVRERRGIIVKLLARLHRLK